MDIKILGFGHDPNHRWASKVARASIAIVADAVTDVPAERSITGTIAFDPDSSSRVRAVVARRQRVAGELEVGFWLPTSDWKTVKKATPLAAAALGSALLDLADSVGADAGEIEAALQSLGTSEYSAVVEMAEPSTEDELPDLLDWLDSFTSVPAEFRSLTSDYSPVGNDTGADLLDAYRIWRSEGQPASRFLPALLAKWEVPDRDWRLLDPEVLKQHLPGNHYEILTRDDAIIALAFSQYFVDGSVQDSVREKALEAIDRQSLEVVLEFRGWADSDCRVETLGRMKDFVEDRGSRPAG